VELGNDPLQNAIQGNMHPILQQGLLKAGVVQMLSWTLVYRPLQYGGLEIPNLYTKQLVAQLLLLFWYGIQVTDSMGVLIWANSEVFI